MQSGSGKVKFKIHPEQHHLEVGHRSSLQESSIQSEEIVDRIWMFFQASFRSEQAIRWRNERLKHGKEARYASLLAGVFVDED